MTYGDQHWEPAERPAPAEGRGSAEERRSDGHRWVGPDRLPAGEDYWPTPGTGWRPDTQDDLAYDYEDDQL